MTGYAHSRLTQPYHMPRKHFNISPFPPKVNLVVQGGLVLCCASRRKAQRQATTNAPPRLRPRRQAKRRNRTMRPHCPLPPLISYRVNPTDLQTCLLHSQDCPIPSPALRTRTRPSDHVSNRPRFLCTCIDPAIRTPLYIVIALRSALACAWAHSILLLVKPLLCSSCDPI